MKKHTKGWTVIRIFVLISILLVEIFGAYWLLFHERQLIASIFYMGLCVSSLIAIIKHLRDCKRKNFLKLCEKDIEDDMRLREKYGPAYDQWKKEMFPNIYNNKGK